MALKYITSYDNMILGMCMINSHSAVCVCVICLKKQLYLLHRR